jgi:hypothetical protein
LPASEASVSVLWRPFEAIGSIPLPETALTPM